MSKAAFAVLLCFSVCVPSRASSQEVRSERSRQLYERACDGGDVVACNIFGLMRETGQGVSQDFEQARELYRRACEGGELTGCTNLGLIYGRGLGVPQDLERARGNYLVACEGGQPLGCDLLAALDSIGAPATASHSARSVDTAGPPTRDGARPDTARMYAKTGRVADASSARGLGEVGVDVPALGIHAISDEEGRVSLGRLPAGQYMIVAERFGYEAVDGTLEVPGSAEFLILLDRADIGDPLATGQVRGRVSDAATHEPLSNVGVDVVGQKGAVLSNTDGRFLLPDVNPGLLEVRLTRIGYVPRTATLVLQPGGEGEIIATMSAEAIELAPIEVTTTGRSAYLDRVGFQDRKKRGFGAQFSREDLDRLHTVEVSDAVRRASGVCLTYGAPDAVSGWVDPTNVIAHPCGGHSLTLGDCTMRVYVDGVRTRNTNLNQLPENWVDAVEVYLPRDAPIQYSGTRDGCGVVLIWTKR